MKQTKLIEFDYEKYKAGAKAVYRSGQVPQMVILPEIPNKEYPLISIDKDGLSNSHMNNGIYFKEKKDASLDLLLEVEEEVEPELFVNVIEATGKCCFSSIDSIIFNDLESATKNKAYNAKTYKLVKVNQ